MLRRKLVLLSVAFYSALMTSAFAQQAAPGIVAGRVIQTSIPAPSLKGSLFAEQLEQPIVVYLPPSYETVKERRFPVVYLLHGFLDAQTAWTGGGYQGMSLGPFMDELIRSGKSKETIVVAPSGKNALMGSFYTNSTTTGNWEDYILRDVIGYIDANYRTLARPESRGIAGHSMGGYGALVLGMKHADTFSAIYALSPCCTAPVSDLGPDNPAWIKALHLTSIDQLKGPPRSPEDFFVRAFVAISAAFSPGSQGPLYANFPYREREGKLEKNEAVYPKWASKFAVNMIEENKQNLSRLRGIFIDYGEKEQFMHIRIGARLVSSALAERDIPHIFEIYGGGNHGNKIRERLETRVFPFFSSRLDFGPDK